MSDPCRSPVVRVLVPAAAPAVRVELPSSRDAGGPDAYAVWLAAGHTGSRADFLASLKGVGLPPSPFDPAADGRRYTHRQRAAAAVWTIPHNLGRRPLVTVLSIGGVVLMAGVVHLSENTLQVVLDDPYPGEAICL